MEMVGAVAPQVHKLTLAHFPPDNLNRLSGYDMKMVYWKLSPKKRFMVFIRPLTVLNRELKSER